MKISAIVPTYRRPNDLRRCLKAFIEQDQMPDELLVVHRPDDFETVAVLSEESWRGLPLRAVLSHLPGQVEALNVALEAAKGQILAITDDDAAPRKDWISRIIDHFDADPSLGGLGGRDHVFQDGKEAQGAEAVVGRVQFFGRPIGRFHLGAGEAREIEMLKGANMSYRRSAIGNLRFDKRLKGAGAQTANDWAFSFGVRKSGWKLVYDPHVAVDHYPSWDGNADHRGKLTFDAQMNNSYNVSLCLLEYLSGTRRLLFILWSILVGTIANPGLVQGVRMLVTGDKKWLMKASASLKGQFDAIETWRKSVKAKPHTALQPKTLVVPL